jgi:transcription initiation factor TFIIIB Brf1 subunit/transcription initiation factor TFIIB
MASQASSNNPVLPERDVDGMPIDKCCDGMRIIETERGEIVCTNCGIVHDERIKKNEARVAYTREESEKRSMHFPMAPGVIPQIRIPKHGKGAVDDAEKWYRLVSLNGRKNDRLHHTYLNKVRADCKDLNLPWHVSETALKIFSECMKNNKLRGRCVIGMSKACIYYACIVNKFPMSIKVLWNDIDARARMQTSLRFAREYANTLYGKKASGIKTSADRKSERVASFCEMIERAANLAGVDGMQCKTMAKEIYSKISAEKEGIIFSGKSPSTIIAALLFIAAKATGACFVTKDGTKKHPTQRVVADCLNITEVSLRNRAKEIAVAAAQIRKRNGASIHPLIDEQVVKYELQEILGKGGATVIEQKPITEPARAERARNRRRSWLS